MSKAELEGAIARVEQWSAPYRRIDEHQRADDLERIIAAARSTIEPEVPTVEFKSNAEPAGETKTIFVPLMLDGSTIVGRLGATAHENASRDYQLMAALAMAERRILRIEEALRNAKIDVDALELPE